VRTILVTGGAGFVGGCYVRRMLRSGNSCIVNLDKLTYAGDRDSIPPPCERHQFVHGDTCDHNLISRVLEQYRPNAIVNFAAESHVDRSIEGPADFVETNVVGTCNLLDRSVEYFSKLPALARESFRFLQVSTDEVYGSLGPTGKFSEQTPFAPSSPYSASKASADLFMRAYRKTYGLPTLITNSSNNYGPHQFPEKLIPLMILNALKGAPLPVYGDGKHVRDWIFVEDHCSAIDAVLEREREGGRAKRTTSVAARENQPGSRRDHLWAG